MAFRIVVELGEKFDGKSFKEIERFVPFSISPRSLSIWSDYFAFYYFFIIGHGANLESIQNTSVLVLNIQCQTPIP